MKCLGWLVVLWLFAGGCGKKPVSIEARPTYSYREVLRWDIPPSPQGQAHGLQGIAIGPAGEVYIADAEGRRIVILNAGGKILREIRPPAKESNLLQMPFALLHDGKGRLYVADYAADQVQVFSLDGRFLSAWGREGAGPGEFRSPVGIARDPAGNLYVVEFYNHRVQKFTQEGKFLLAWGEEGDWNRPDQPPEKMLYPAGIDVGPDGNVYVADSGRDRIKVFSPEGKFLREFGAKGPEPGKFNAVAGLSFDAAGRLHEADSAAHRVQMFSRDGAFLAAWTLPDAGRLVIWSPSRILADGDHLFVSDVAANRVYKLKLEEARKP
jgi:tripartite motif-containing protein 71